MLRSLQSHRITPTASGCVYIFVFHCINVKPYDRLVHRLCVFCICFVLVCWIEKMTTVWGYNKHNGKLLIRITILTTCVCFFFVLNFAYAQKPFSLIYETPVWHWMSSLNLFDGLLSHRFSQKYIYMRLRAMCNEYQFLFFFSFAICLLNALAAVSSKTYSMLNFNQKQCQINLTVLLWWKRIHYDFFPFRKKLEKEIPPGKIVFLMITRKRLYYIYLMRIFICNSAVSNCRRFCEFAISDNADLSRLTHFLHT